ncbi:hypothetical protein LXL04_023587 [Taraxacum kok-saghyz]
MALKKYLLLTKVTMSGKSSFRGFFCQFWIHDLLSRLQQKNIKFFFPISGGILQNKKQQVSWLWGCFFGCYGWVLEAKNQNARTYIDKGQFGHSDQICNFHFWNLLKRLLKRKWIKCVDICNY